DLKELIEAGRDKLSSKVSVIGFCAILGEDEAFGVPSNKVFSARFPLRNKPLVEGEQIRDWGLKTENSVIFPYDSEIAFNLDDDQSRYLWPLRTQLWGRNTFGKQTYKDAGRHFAEYHQIPVDRNK
ncbi:hypothetical protein, partial [Pseudomonas aeruginosa]